VAMEFAVTNEVLETMHLAFAYKYCTSLPGIACVRVELFTDASYYTGKRVASRNVWLSE